MSTTKKHSRWRKLSTTNSCGWPHFLAFFKCVKTFVLVVDYFCLSGFPHRFKTWRIAEVKYLVKKTFFLIFLLHIPYLELSGNDTIITAACAHQQVMMQDILSKTIERQIWRKVRSRDFWAACRRNWHDGDFIANLRIDRGAFLLVFC